VTAGQLVLLWGSDVGGAQISRLGVTCPATPNDRLSAPIGGYL
jgi:hypothetical protein